MAARPSANIQPRADQPTVSTKSLYRTESTPNLEYRVEATKSFNRSPTVRNYRSSKRA